MESTLGKSPNTQQVQFCWCLYVVKKFTVTSWVEDRTLSLGEIVSTKAQIPIFLATEMVASQ